ncbi:unnamed protein product, partial [Oppiella nova]
MSDIVISGMSGRFPLSDTTDEFAKNLFDGIDMVTDDDSRWPKGLYDMSNRMGRIVTYDRFDAQFFGMTESMAQKYGPQLHMLLESTYESIVDAGISPQNLRGSRTGVYCGIINYAKCDGYSEYPQPDHTTQMNTLMMESINSSKSFFASRTAFIFDLKGPAIVVDTACSSSLSAFALAVNDLKL